MTTWVKDRFSDNDHALTTIVWGAAIVGAVGFFLVIGGVLLAQ